MVMRLCRVCRVRHQTRLITAISTIATTTMMTIVSSTEICSLLVRVVITGEQYDPDTANTDTAGLWNGHGHWPVVAPPKPPTPPTHPQEDDMKIVFAQGDALPGVPKES